MTGLQRTRPGAIALVGSGEYLPQMRAIDRMLLDTLASQPARVALLPTASGLEPGMPERWNSLGAEHFRALGAEVTPVHLVSSADAHDPQVESALRGAGLYYFSGGNPEHVIETLRDTPAWRAVHDGWRAGAALAGCSAGAMMLGSHTLSVRSVMRGQAPRWVPALGVVPGIAVMPHFDRMADFAGAEVFRAILASAPAGVTLIGVDEDTALVRAGGTRWQALGRQSVAVFRPDGERMIFRAGEWVDLG